MEKKKNQSNNSKLFTFGNVALIIGFIVDGITIITILLSVTGILDPIIERKLVSPHA